MKALAIDEDAVYLGGDFSAANGAITRNRAAAVDRTMGKLRPWDPNLNQQVSALAVSGSTVYLGGQFLTVNGGLTRKKAAAVDKTTGQATPWNPDLGGAVILNATVEALAFSESTLFLGGNFTSANDGSRRGYAAEVDSITGILTPWTPEFSQPVSAMAMDCASGNLIVGGAFSSVGSTAQAGLARFPTRANCPGFIIDNQLGDDTWRGANSGLYDVDFVASPGLAKFEVQVFSGPGETGTLRQPWAQVRALVGTRFTENWALPPTSREAMADGLSYVSVRVESSNGERATRTDAFYVKKDTTAPRAGRVEAQVSGSALSAKWKGFWDAESGIVGFAWAIGTSAGAQDVQPFVAVGDSTSATSAGVALVEGATYFVTVQATDGVGLTTSVSSEPVLFPRRLRFATGCDCGASGAHGWELAVLVALLRVRQARVR